MKIRFTGGAGFTGVAASSLLQWVDYFSPALKPSL